MLSSLTLLKVLSFALKEGKVAVHCHAGLGRTGVLIACYLVYYLRYPKMKMKLQAYDQAILIFQGSVQWRHPLREIEEAQRCADQETDRLCQGVRDILPPAVHHIQVVKKYFRQIENIWVQITQFLRKGTYLLPCPCWKCLPVVFSTTAFKLQASQYWSQCVWIRIYKSVPKMLSTLSGF